MKQYLVIKNDGYFRIYLKCNIDSSISKIHLRMPDDSDVYFTSKQITNPLHKIPNVPALYRVTYQWTSYSRYRNGTSEERQQDGRLSEEEVESWTDWYNFVKKLPASQMKKTMESMPNNNSAWKEPGGNAENEGRKQLSSQNVETTENKNRKTMSANSNKNAGTYTFPARVRITSNSFLRTINIDGRDFQVPAGGVIPQQLFSPPFILDAVVIPTGNCLRIKLCGGEIIFNWKCDNNSLRVDMPSDVLPRHMNFANGYLSRDQEHRIVIIVNQNNMTIIRDKETLVSLSGNYDKSEIVGFYSCFGGSFILKECTVTKF